MNAANGIRARNTERMNEVQRLMESNAHLDEGEDYNRLEELLSKLSMYFNVLTNEDRDYIQACRYAIDEKVDWSI
ncbi:MAG: hypothetical protein CBD03_05320 [Rhizobiales bacterium TMED143]|nr:MAG: hypothetical protein CBD03_05320 [Rhizobiales bacterium TMED143]|tara:strand:+ start:470 stop:694 length:225 start_codon:yes stop_codon:yes gene_type:complete